MIVEAARALLVSVAGERRRLFFPFLLPGANELEKAQRRRVYVNDNPRSLYSVIREKALHDCVMFARGFGRHWGPPPAGRVAVFFEWREPNKKRDPANVINGGQKIIFDALKAQQRGRGVCAGAGLIHCDGWHCTGGLVYDHVTIDRARPGVEVIVVPMQAELRFPLPVPGGVDLREAA